MNPSGTQRAFAAKRNKMTAADVRRHIMTGSLLLHPQSSHDCADQSTESIRLIEVVDPLNIEVVLSQQKSSASAYEHCTSRSCTSPRRLTVFPSDDIDVRLVHREQPSVEHLYMLSSDVDPIVRDIINTYSDDFSMVQRRYQHFSSADAYIRMLMERPILAQSIPKQIYEMETEQEVHRCASIVNDKRCINRDSYGSYCSSDSTCVVEFLPGSSAIDHRVHPHRLASSASDPLVSGVTQRISFNQLDQINENRRQLNRQNLVINLLPPQLESDVIERRSCAPFPSEQIGQKLFIKILDLQLEPKFEPIFGSLALYDAKERRKISENFYFDFNDDSLQALIFRHVDHTIESDSCNQALFSISQSITDVFLVIRLEKILQPCDVVDGCEPYAREDTNVERLIQCSRQYCDRLGAYRMPLGWMAIDLMRLLSGAQSLEKSDLVSNHMSTLLKSLAKSESDVAASSGRFGDNESIVSVDRVSCSTTGTFRRIGSGASANAVYISNQKSRNPVPKRKTTASSQGPVQGNGFVNCTDTLEGLGNDSNATVPMLNNLHPLLLNLSSFFRQESDRLSDEDICKILIESRKGGSKFSRLKIFPVTMKMEISNGCREESLIKIASESTMNTLPCGNASEMFREVVEFRGSGVYAVSASYRNLLFVYLRSVNFSNRSGVRNILVRVQLMNGQECPLPQLFDKSKPSELKTFANTAVSYHIKAPSYYEEIKLAIPMDLNDGHHLLFTFYHIACKPNKVHDEVEVPVGYSWIPLYANGRLQTGDFTLPVALERLPNSYGYLSPEVNLPNIKWLDGHKPLFSVSLTAISTVHSQDRHLNDFFSAYHSLKSVDKKIHPVDEGTLISMIKGVIKARPEPMIAFLYVILDKLLGLIANPPYSVAVSEISFEVLGQLVKICTMLLDRFRDSHGRSSLLTTYIHYHKIFLKDSCIQLKVPLVNDEYQSKGINLSTSDNQQLMDIIKQFERSTYLKASDEDDVNTSSKIMHEELVLQWIASTGAAREMAFFNAWFFLELMVKSIAEYLSKSNRLYLARKLRFSESFMQGLNALSHAIIIEILNRASKDPRQSQSISSSWAFFLRDSISIMDRTYVMKLIKIYNHEVTAKITLSTEPLVTTLMLIKLDFIRIVSSHEHFLMLNIPFDTACECMIRSQSGGSITSASPTLSNESDSIMMQRATKQFVTLAQAVSSNKSNLYSGTYEPLAATQSSLVCVELPTEFRSRHFLTGLVLADLAAVLGTSNTLLHTRAIALVRNLLSTHEADSRVNDQFIKARAALLYRPLLGIVLDASAQLHDPFSRGSLSRESQYGVLTATKLRRSPSTSTLVSSKVMLAIGGLNSSPPCSPKINRSAPVLMKHVLSLELTRQLLACFCWTLKNMERQALLQWVLDLHPNRLSSFLYVLQLCVSCFEYKSGAFTNFDVDEESIVLCGKELNNTITSEEIRKEVSRKKSRMESDTVKWRKNSKEIDSWKRNTYSSDDRSCEESNDDDAILEALLCTEVPLIVLDTLESMLQSMSLSDSNNHFFVYSSAIRIIMHMLGCNQSVQTYENLFASQRALVIKYPDLVFEQETEQCGELCLLLLRHCASRLPAIRSQAAASLYLLMRQSFESGQNLSKVKMQLTMSLSTLVSTGTSYGDWINESCLRRSLKTVLNYAEIDASADTSLRSNTFSEQVKDSVFNLHMILSDTVKMKEYSNDYEMLIDLMYRVAKGYQNNPDLRLTWLINMANKHAARDYAAEAAQCILHAAALGAEYISMREHDSYIPKGAVAFIDISDNVLEESAVSDDVISPEKEGICESQHFTLNGLIHLVEKTAFFMEKAQMYEMMLPTYKVITAILEKNRDYKRLAEIHGRLSDALSRIEPCVSFFEEIADAWYSPLPCADKRCFGTYFRVGFYGSRFADLDGTEFIYKEPAITKLSEISHRLENFYADRFGKDVVELIKDSNTVDKNRLDTTKCYVQVTYVEPYLERWERRRRATHFERNHKLNRFVYATPFTKDGRPHGDLKDQYKRRTILSTQFSFPYVKTRLRVIRREQTVLTPIEVAIEDIQKKTRELTAATAQNPPDAKMLQMVLQGCIGTTVNQGPIQVANVFLSDVPLDEHEKPLDKYQNKLRLCFKDFSKKCADALQKNKQLIQMDQLAYQNELQKIYIDFTRKMTPILGVNSRSKSKSVKGSPLRNIFAADMGTVTCV